MTAAGCSPGSSSEGADPTTTTTATTTTVDEPTTTTTPSPAGVSADFERTVVEIDGVPYTVAVAQTRDELAQGLMGVEDLGPLDGMLFVYSTESIQSHWMKDTLIPLDIAFFDASGFLVSVESMTTCPDDDCPSYASAGPARYSIEVPFGGFADLPADARLVIIDALDGSGKEI
ncbi:MAG: DUF192 domain-containing protein [Acidimicrobiia bacterium]|nr:DUF192 domain-containing protein [Acidimicrobiia bacterium]